MDTRDRGVPRVEEEPPRAADHVGEEGIGRSPVTRGHDPLPLMVKANPAHRANHVGPEVVCIMLGQEIFEAPFVPRRGTLRVVELLNLLVTRCGRNPFAQALIDRHREPPRCSNRLSGLDRSLEVA